MLLTVDTDYETTEIVCK